MGNAGEQVPFAAHGGLLRLFLAHREQAVEAIQQLLNAQQQPVAWQEHRPLLAARFEDSFFSLPAVPRSQLALRGQLQQAHWARGFRPRDMAEMPNDLFDPAELMVRAFRMWRQLRWPGRNGRVRFAQTLFNVYLLRCLTLLAMRLWDADLEGAAARLDQLQSLLDALWSSSPADQPVLVRDACWLLPLAQSPVTDELTPYFPVAEHIAASLPLATRLPIHQASVQMAGGHLRSQLRHYDMQGHALDEADVVLDSRGSNALDFALTLQNLVPLLAAYEAAIGDGDEPRRIALASAICQGFSPDPELFVDRVELFGAYSMVEYLFAQADEQAGALLTPTGARHLRLLDEYAARVARLAPALLADCGRFRPVAGAYSPYGVMYGFAYNLIEHMALKATQPGAITRYGLEDVFVDGDASADKLAWVTGWRQLPHMSAEVLKFYEYPQGFAEKMFARVEQALQRRVAEAAGAAPRPGRIHLHEGAAAAGITELPVAYRLSSDPQRVAAGEATAIEQSKLLADRREGMYLVSYPTADGWEAVSKDLLTTELGAGRDLHIALPREAAAVVKLLYPALLARD